MSRNIIAAWLAANIHATEGSVNEQQIGWFMDWLNKPDGAPVHTILEIGFNGGLSAATFLAARPNTRVVSVDLGAHEYVLKAKTWLDNLFPGRHQLIIGDSKNVLPVWELYFKDGKFDMIFVDGGHDYFTVKLDLENAHKLARPNTWVILDDVSESEPEVVRALQEQLKDRKWAVLGQYKCEGRSWVVMKPIAWK